MAYLLSKASVVSLSTKNTYFANNNWNQKNAMEIATAGLKYKRDIEKRLQHLKVQMQKRLKYITTSSDFNSTFISPHLWYN